ncbi:phage distal tail protein [Sporosarcina sp. FSL K6-3457]|uniref:phage distal tail protein n=1 Tax=Sporosarcina sp. FSL K6-3457 TaxID=2978204 RepID=UPI0030F9DD7B
MFKLQFENSRGQKIELFGAPFRLFGVEGLGDVEADIQSQVVPYQDGDALIDVILRPRYMTVELKITGNDAAETEANRRKLASVFNPRLGLGTLKYVRGTEVKLIKTVAESVPIFPDGPTNRGATFQKALLHLKAPNPYWRSTSITEEPAFEPLFEFPFEGEFEFGVTRNDRLIYNDGDAPAAFQVDFYGPANSPIIENLTTGEFIRINKRLEEGQTLKIDTTDGVKSVTYVDEDGAETNVFHWIDLSSTFFKLGVGENDITCHCAISNRQRDFDIYYHKLFTAV